MTLDKGGRSAIEAGEKTLSVQVIRGAGLVLVLMFAIAAARPAVAQIMLGPQIAIGSPADPPRVALGGGAFDVIEDRKKPGAGATGLVLSEYRFGDVLWMFAPLIGVMGTAKGAFYGYGGFGFDINLFEKWVITPTAAVGYFSHGSGIDLGAHTEFRTGAEFDYRFDNLVRLGAGFYHMSNAGIGKKNPGVELATVVLTVPLR
jgi:lipid A 3-O-deacylase